MTNPTANGCSRQSNDDNTLPDITTQDIEHARIVLGLNNRGGRPAASKHAVSPRPRKKNVGTQEPRRKMFARKLAASAFRTARWGRP
jgi:hypothetical protein